MASESITETAAEMPANKKPRGNPAFKKGHSASPATQFKKGQSGNPNGRPKIPEDIKKAFKEASKGACEVLTSIMLDPTAKDVDRIRAAEVILDRGWGKAVQAVDVETNGVPQVVFVGYDSIAD